MSESDTVSGQHRFIEKGLVRESISKARNEKAIEPSGLVSGIVKSADDLGVDMARDLINQMLVEDIIPAEWEVSTCQLL